MRSGKVVLALLAYNHKKFIEQCVLSLAEQTYKNFIVVFVDDGSSDGTFEAGKALLQGTGIEAICIQSRDNGICRNLNLARRSCGGGEFFAVLSADDWLYPTSFEDRIMYLNAHEESAMVYSPVTLYFEGTGRSEIADKPYSEGFVYAQLLAENFIPANAAMVRMAVLDECGGFDEKLAVEDWDLWLRIAERHRIGFLSHPTAYYRQHGGNMSRDFKSMVAATLDILKKHLTHEVARRRHDRLMVQYAVEFESIPAAAKAIMTYGGLNWFTARQLAKLLVRPWREGKRT